MPDYTGTKCIVCSEQFKKDDDIVVCPDCGTPYHRGCYMKNSKCVNTSLHESGKSWQPSIDITGNSPEGSSAEANAVCRRCGYHNKEDELFCERCGFPMQALERHNEILRDQQNMQNGAFMPENGIKDGFEENIRPFLVNFSDPLCGYNPDEDFDGVRLCELGDYIESNTHYYLPYFKRIKETGRAVSWNFSAMLFPEFYFANRKMPLIALAAFIIRLFAITPYYISVLSQTNIAVLSEIAKSFDTRGTAFHILDVMSYVLTYAMMFFFGAFANWIYYKHAVKRTAKIKSSVPPQMLRETLRRKGGTSALWLVLSILVYFSPYCLVFLFSYYGALFK